MRLFGRPRNSSPPSLSLEEKTLWRVSSVDVLPVYVPPRSAALETSDDTLEADNQRGILAALLPPADETTCPDRNSGLVRSDSVHLMKAATLIVEKWETVTSVWKSNPRMSTPHFPRILVQMVQFHVSPKTGC